MIYVNPKAENNQSGEAGTLLVELDPRDYEVELDHAKADLDQLQLALDFLHQYSNREFVFSADWQAHLGSAGVRCGASNCEAWGQALR